MKLYYFAYGSNLNLARMRERCPDAVAISPAVLAGYKLVERTYADIEIAADEYVNGALYKISDQDLANLDCYEGYPDCYLRKEILVTDSAGVFRRAWVFIMTREYAERSSGGCYSVEYRQTCSEGANSWGIPNAFLEEEKERPCSLWKKGEIPELKSGLAQMRVCLDSGEVIPRAKRLWIGARVIICLKEQNLDGDSAFYPAPFEVVTPHALELSWILNDLRNLFIEAGILNSMNKFDFYKGLAETAFHAIRQNPAIGARQLCRNVLEKAEEFIPVET